MFFHRVKASFVQHLGIPFVVLLSFLGASSVFAQISKVSQTAWDVLTEQAQGDCSQALIKDIRFADYVWIRKEIADRVERIQDNRSDLDFASRPPILNESTGAEINVTHALALQYGSELIQASFQQVFNLVSEVGRKWGSAAREHALKLVSERWNKNREMVKLNADLARIRYAGIFPDFFQVPRSDADPTLVDVADHVARLIRDPLYIDSLPEKYRKEIKEKQAKYAKNPNDKSAVYTAAQSMHLEAVLQQELVNQLSKDYQERLKALKKQAIDHFGQEALRKAIERDPTAVPGEFRAWNSFLTLDPVELASVWIEGVAKLTREFRTRLEALFPITAQAQLSFETQLTALSKIQEATQGLSMFRDFFSPDGLALKLDLLQLDAAFNTKIGTTLMTIANPKTNVETGASKSLQQLKGPILYVWHGEGAMVSTSASWRNLMSNFNNAGMVPFASDLPMAALGMRIRGDRQTSSYMDMNVRYIKNELVNHSDGKYLSDVEVPVIVDGRSLGATKAFSHAVKYDGLDNPVSLYVLESFSNPHTEKQGTENVYAQLKAKSIEGVIEEAMQNGEHLSLELLDTLEAMIKKDPALFKLFGNHILVAQGEADQDGGSFGVAIPELEKFMNKYAPLAHRFYFYMPEHQKPAYERFTKGLAPLPGDGDAFEAVHNLNSNRPDNAFGQLESQNNQLMALRWGAMDYLIAGLPSTGTWPTEAERKLQEKLRAYRDHLHGPGVTFFEVFVKKLKIKMEDIDAANPNDPQTRVMTERLARVKKFWRDEATRVEGHYRAEGLLE